MGATTEIVFRKMIADDAEEVAALDLKSFGTRDAWDSDYFFYTAGVDQAEYIVGESHGKIIACAGVGFFEDASEIETIAVMPEYQRQGVGTKLFAELLDTITARHAEMIFLEVRPSNTAAVNFYEKIGFKTVEISKNFYGDEDAYIMMKENFSNPE
ncbi:MAG: ribosomal protein S18-alanine N-acetyltransferase [Selenomonadaceae bacterium]|nr:ribosomal protein S18-alanine N-acetyltransferase [Selenomonadaceae bacterium]